MNNSREIKEQLQRLVGTYGKDFVSTIDGEVKSVNESLRTCVVEPQTGTISTILEDVALCADPTDGVIQVPEVGSTVRVAVTDKSEYYVLQFSDITKFRVTINNMEFTITENEILLGDGSKGGMINIATLVNKVNAIESRLNAVMTWGAGVTPPFTPNPIIPTTRTELENTKIKHGI